MPVSVVSRSRLTGVSSARVAADVRCLLRMLGEPHAELTVSLVNDDQIHQLNRDYRGKDRPTDVLAFAMREGARAPRDDVVLGDVIVSLETAARQARRRRVPLAAEVRCLLIHGVLHLLGYDHERSTAEARRMRTMERRLRRRLEQGVHQPAGDAKRAVPRRPQPTAQRSGRG